MRGRLALAALGLAAARPEEACGEIKFQFAARSNNQINWLISTRVKTVLEARLGAAGRAVERLWARQAEGLCGTRPVTKRPRLFFTRR